MTVTAEQLTAFCAEIVKIIDEYAERMGYREGVCYRHVSAEVGKVYARIVVRRNAEDQHGSAYGFIRLEDGAILKAASFKAPAKHTRGHIDNPRACCGPHGVAYLR